MQDDKNRITKPPLTAWGDDVALLGPNAPKDDGKIKHLIEYLLTVYERFGNTRVTFKGIQWGASALWKDDEQEKRIAELEAKLAAASARSAEPHDLTELLATKEALSKARDALTHIAYGKWGDHESASSIAQRALSDVASAIPTSSAEEYSDSLRRTEHSQDFNKP